MKKFLSILLVSFAISIPLCSQATVIDFEQLKHIDSIEKVHGSQYIEDGFQIDEQKSIFQSGLASYGTLSPRYIGSTALFRGFGPSHGFKLSKVDGGTFDLLSIDLAELDIESYANFGNFFSTEIKFVRDGGYSQTFVLDGKVPSAETFFFDAKFQDSSVVYWDNNYPSHQFDNITIADDVSSVPEPPMLLLLGAAFIGLVGRKCKQT